MYVLSISLIGHRTVSDHMNLKDSLIEIIEILLKKYTYLDFYLGRNGEFDTIAASAIKNCKEHYPDRINFTLVLPYKTAKYEYYCAYYGNVITFSNTRVFYKRAITERNKWLIDNTQVLIAFVHRDGGANEALQYAITKGKKIIYL